jgi:hypothetical protein
MNDQVSVNSPIMKIISALGFVGITSWSEFASACAAIYTLLLISEWVWKKFVRPAFIRRGIVAGDTDGE